MKNKILPIITVIIVIIAICIVVFKHKDSKVSGKATNTITTTSSLATTNNEISTTTKTNVSTSESSRKIDATLDENGDIIIKLENLDSSNATFITYKTENGYKVELVAVKDENNNIDVAFNTCQVCNGSPRAYFVQKSGKLICQNCGNIFSLSSIGQNGAGCTPITISDSNMTKIENGVIISKQFLIQNEILFKNVAEH